LPPNSRHNEPRNKLSVRKGRHRNSLQMPQPSPRTLRQMQSGKDLLPAEPKRQLRSIKLLLPKLKLKQRRQELRLKSRKLRQKRLEPKRTITNPLPTKPRKKLKSTKPPPLTLIVKLANTEPLLISQKGMPTGSKEQKQRQRDPPKKHGLPLPWLSNKPKLQGGILLCTSYWPKKLKQRRRKAGQRQLKLKPEPNETLL